MGEHSVFFFFFFFAGGAGTLSIVSFSGGPKACLIKRIYMSI